MTDVSKLILWLREQVDEVRYQGERGYLHSPLEPPGGHWKPTPGELPDPDRLSVVRLPPAVQPLIIAQCDAHDALLDLITLVIGADRRSDLLRYQMLRGLALAYQHHPGYRAEWRPSGGS